MKNPYKSVPQLLHRTQSGPRGSAEMQQTVEKKETKSNPIEPCASAVFCPRFALED